MSRLRRPLVALLVALLCALSFGSHAQTLADPQWDTLHEAGQFEELGRLAGERLKSQPNDPQATLALGLAAMGGREDGKLEDALKQAQRCVQALPTSSVCHYALGSVLGNQAMRAGPFKALRLTGTIKDSLTRAVELDPGNIDAREALVMFYLLAPGIAGGSVHKAGEVAQQAQARQPEHSKLLLARVALHEKQAERVEQLLLSVNLGSDKSLRDSVREGWGSLGASWLQQKQPEKAKAVFERLQREHPDHALGSYGLGRAMLELGAVDDALAQWERGRKLKGADRFPFDYRMALAWLQKGDKGRARPLLERFVTAGKGPVSSLEDARKRLASLS